MKGRGSVLSLPNENGIAVTPQPRFACSVVTAA
jgi:hypothetical protein